MSQPLLVEPNAYGNPEIVAVKGFLREEQLKNLLAMSVFEPTPEKLERFIKVYTEHPSICALGYHKADRWLGLLIAKRYGEELELRCISVDQPAQRQGIGSKLLQACIERHAPSKVAAETDREGIGFYRSLGFECVSLGDIYGGGEERFQCTLNLRERY